MDKHLPYGLACRLHSLLSVLKTFLPCLGKNIDSAVQHLTMLLIGYHDIYSSIKLVNYCWVLPLIGRRDIYSPIQLVSHGIRLVSHGIRLVNYCWVLPLIGRRSWVDVTFIVRFNLSATVSVLWTESSSETKQCEFFVIYRC